MNIQDLKAPKILGRLTIAEPMYLKVLYQDLDPSSNSITVVAARYELSEEQMFRSLSQVDTPIVFELQDGNRIAKYKGTAMDSGTRLDDEGRRHPLLRIEHVEMTDFQPFETDEFEKMNKEVLRREQLV
jgi:hypothetical protein